MSLKFYTDTHIPKQVALQLRAKGVDIVRCEEVDLATASDLEHLEYAVREHRALISKDMDFRDHYAEWIAQGKSHAGIFTVSRNLSGQALITRLVTDLYEYWQLIELDVGTLEGDIENKLIWIK